MDIVMLSIPLGLQFEIQNNAVYFGIANATEKRETIVPESDLIFLS
jgi:hypothetical protein